MFSFRKRSAPVSSGGPLHKILQSETRKILGDPIKYGTFLSANILAAEAIEPLVADLIQNFKQLYKESPAAMSVLLITLIGPCNIDQLLAAWHAALDRDRVTAHWLARMEKAEVGHAVTPSALGKFYSLLPRSREPS